MKQEIIKAIKELRKNIVKRNFNQGVDLIINLKKFDIRKESVNLSIQLPNKVKEYKIAAFLNQKSSLIHTIEKTEFDKYKDKKKVKKLLRDYNYFISAASLMPAVATSFGRFLGPAGKMPAPGLGIIGVEDENTIKNEIKKFDKALKIKTKEASIKTLVGNEKMSDEEITSNIEKVYKEVERVLPKNKENIKNIIIKFTMGKPKKLIIK